MRVDPDFIVTARRDLNRSKIDIDDQFAARLNRARLVDVFLRAPQSRKRGDEEKGGYLK